jgi:hypothetical protein
VKGNCGDINRLWTIAKELRINCVTAGIQTKHLEDKIYEICCLSQVSYSNSAILDLTFSQWWLTDVSEALFTNCLTLVSCLAYSSTMKMEATCSSEKSVGFQQTTERYIPQDITI